MREIKVGDVVEINNYNKYWDGTRATVVAFDLSPEYYGGVYPYKLKALTDTPLGHKKAGELIGSWSDEYIRRTPDKVDEAVASFSHPLDVFYSPHSGGAVVLSAQGKLFRILPDGEIDD